MAKVSIAWLRTSRVASAAMCDDDGLDHLLSCSRCAAVYGRTIYRHEGHAQVMDMPAAVLTTLEPR
eukprot:5143330-Pleurochrysis_carterae.AAC.2